MDAPSRQALRHIVRNTTLSQRTRAEAHLQLMQLPTYSRPTQIRNRCLMGGEGRGVLRDFKLSRVSFRRCKSKRERAAAQRMEQALTNPVQLPFASTGRKPAGCEEGQLVESQTRRRGRARQRRSMMRMDETVGNKYQDTGGTVRYDKTWHRGCDASMGARGSACSADCILLPINLLKI